MLKINLPRLAIILVTGIVVIAAVYRLCGDIQRNAENRLKTEEAITGVLNKQRLEHLH